MMHHKLLLSHKNTARDLLRAFNDRETLLTGVSILTHCGQEVVNSVFIIVYMCTCKLSHK